MPRDLRKICFDILQAISEVEEFTRNKTLPDYQNDRMLKMAIEREYEIIGEALRRIETEFPEKFVQITDGRKIIDFRNILAHGYDAISDEIVWSITQGNMQKLKLEIQKFLK
jgi:uncharacterized protein with HEPN domain